MNLGKPCSSLIYLGRGAAVLDTRVGHSTYPVWVPPLRTTIASASSCSS